MRKRVLLCILGIFSVCAMAGCSDVNANRYGSLATYKDTLYYYANNAIYSYTEQNQSKKLLDDTALSFAMADQLLFYQKKDAVTEGICYDVSTQQEKYRFEIPEEHIVDTEIGIDGSVLFTKSQNKNGQECYHFYDIDSGAQIDDTVSKEDIDTSDGKISGQNQAPELEGFFDEMCDPVVADNDIAYIRFPAGDSCIRSYDIVRDADGKIEKLIERGEVEY